MTAPSVEDFARECCAFVGHQPYSHWGKAIELHRAYLADGGKQPRARFLAVLEVMSGLEAHRTGRDALRVPWILRDNARDTCLAAWARDNLVVVEPLERRVPAKGDDTAGRRQRDWPTVTTLHAFYVEACRGCEPLGLVRFSSALEVVLGVSPMLRFGAKRFPVRIKGYFSPPPTGAQQSHATR